MKRLYALKPGETPHAARERYERAGKPPITVRPGETPGEAHERWKREHGAEPSAEEPDAA
jgi:hypothetical protein